MMKDRIRADERYLNSELDSGIVERHEVKVERRFGDCFNKHQIAALFTYTCIDISSAHYWINVVLLAVK